MNRVTHLTDLPSVLSVLLTISTFMLGGVDDSIMAFMLLVFIDYLTGLRKAWKQKNLSSQVGRKGIEKKAMMFVVIIVAHMIDKVIGTSGEKLSIRSGVMLAYSCNEALSILENLRAVGTWIPTILEERLIQLRNSKGKKDSKPCEDCPSLKKENKKESPYE